MVNKLVSATASRGLMDLALSEGLPDTVAPPHPQSSLTFERPTYGVDQGRIREEMEPLLVVLLVVVAGANPEAPDARRTHTDHLFATRMFSFETTQIFYAG